MFESDQVGLQQRHAGAAVETEVRHPVTPQEPPRRWGRMQVVGLVLFIGIPLVACILLDKM